MHGGSGELKVAEVQSRFDGTETLKQFVAAVESCGFRLLKQVWSDVHLSAHCRYLQTLIA